MPSLTNCHPPPGSNLVLVAPMAKSKQRAENHGAGKGSARHLQGEGQKVHQEGQRGASRQTHHPDTAAHFKSPSNSGWM